MVIVCETLITASSKLHYTTEANSILSRLYGSEGGRPLLLLVFMCVCEYMQHCTIVTLLSFPLWQYNDIVMNERERATMADSAAVPSNEFGVEPAEEHVV